MEVNIIFLGLVYVVALALAILVFRVIRHDFNQIDEVRKSMGKYNKELDKNIELTNKLNKLKED